MFLDTTVEVLEAALDDLRGREWDLLFLGACVYQQDFPFAEGSALLSYCVS